MSNTNPAGRTARLARWSVALGLLLAAILLGGVNQLPRVCFDELAQSDVAVELCRPLEISDPLAVTYLLLVLLLLWPDVSEIGALGVSLKRRVDRVESTAQTAVERVDSLQTLVSTQSTRLEQLVTSSNNAVAQVVGPFYVNGPGQIRDVLEHLPGKEAAFRRTAAPADSAAAARNPTPPVDAADDSQARAALTYQILQGWEYLDRHLRISPLYRRPEVPLGLAPPPRLLDEGQRERYVNVFDEELRLVRAARNAAAHDADISIDDLREAVQIAERLRALIDELDEAAGDDGALP